MLKLMFVYLRSLGHPFHQPQQTVFSLLLLGGCDSCEYPLLYTAVLLFFRPNLLDSKLRT